jgi:excisionase family DNA binding protein
MELPILAAPIPKAADILGIRESKLRELIRDGALETIAIGCRRLILYSSLQRFVESLRGQPNDPRRNRAVAKAGERRHRAAAQAAE